MLWVPLPAELALQQQLFNHQQQFLHQKILEEQFARNRDFLLMSEAEREKQLGLIFHQVNLQLLHHESGKSKLSQEEYISYQL